MTPAVGQVGQVITRLRELGVAFAVVGGLAVSARTEPRFTRDLDLAVAVDSDREAETLISRLRSEGYQPAFLVEQEAVGRLATVRLTHEDEGGAASIVDLLFASSGVEQEVVAAATALELFEGVVAPVATVGSLIALKLLARDDRTRPQDAGDLRELLGAATDADLKEAQDLCRLIMERGYDRGRDLGARLAAARTDRC